MAEFPYSRTVDVARLERLDAELVGFAAALALVSVAGPVSGRTAWKRLAAARQQVEVVATRTADEVACLRGTPLGDWPGRRAPFVAIAATLGSVGRWLCDLGAAEGVGGAADFALGWMGGAAASLGMAADAAVEQIDADLAEMLRQVGAEAATASMEGA